LIDQDRHTYYRTLVPLARVILIRKAPVGQERKVQPLSDLTYGLCVACRKARTSAADWSAISSCEKWPVSG
jgi:hypothetical protein